MKDFFKQEQIDPSMITNYEKTKAIYHSMRKMMRDICQATDIGCQLKYLDRLYKWYAKKLENLGEMRVMDKEEDMAMFYPEKLEEIKQACKEEKENKRLNLLDTDKINQYELEQFREGARTAHT